MYVINIEQSFHLSASIDRIIDASFLSERAFLLFLSLSVGGIVFLRSAGALQSTFQFWFGFLLFFWLVAPLVLPHLKDVLEVDFLALLEFFAGDGIRGWGQWLRQNGAWLWLDKRSLIFNFGVVGCLRCGEYFVRLDAHGFVDISFAVVSSAEDEIADGVSYGGQPDEVASFVDV